MCDITSHIRLYSPHKWNERNTNDLLGFSVTNDWLSTFQLVINLYNYYLSDGINNNICCIEITNYAR